MAAPDEPEEDAAPSSLGPAAAGLVAGAGLAAALAGGDDATADAPELKMDLEEPPAVDDAPAAPAEDLPVLDQDLLLPDEELPTLDEERPVEETPEDDDLVTDEINLDELDLLLEDEPLPAGPEPEDDFKTEELNLSDLEKMLGDDAAEAAVPETTSPPVDDLNAFQEETEESIIEDLDLDMDDLESLLDEDTDLGEGLEAPGQASEASGDEVELDLAPGLEDLLGDDVQEIDIEETEEIGLAEVEDTASGLDVASPGGDATADDEVNLELAPGIDSLFDEVEDQDVPLEETEELDFASLGGDIGALEQPAEDDAQVPDSLDLELDLDSGDEAASIMEDDDLVLAPDGAREEDPAPSVDALDELDLGDLESALDDDGSTDALQLSPGEEQPELVLDLEGDTEEPASAEDMDLSLDDLEVGKAEAPVSGAADETRELELDELDSLLDDIDAPSAETPPDKASDIEGLELDLDLDEDEDVGTVDEPDDATRELDLNDIEKILESQGDAPPAVGADEASDLELDLDLGDADADAPAELDLLGSDETTEGSDSLDLSELEKMLDVEDTTDSATLPVDTDVEELDLDFDLQPTADDGENLELEFDMLEEEGEEASALFDTSESEDLGLELDMGDTPEPEKVELQEDLEFEILDEAGKDDLDLEIVEDDAGGDDLELDLLEDDGEEFDLDIVEDDAEAAPVEAAAMAATGAAASRDLTQELMDEMAAADTQTMDIPPAETKPIKPAPVPKKKKTSKSLVVLLLLVLLAAGGYVAYTTMGLDASKLNLSNLPEIPFISKWLGGKKAPEAIVPVKTSLKDNWIQNKNDGRLYIIQGRVKNEYSEPRSFIRVTGRVFADGRNFKKAAQAYCGNMPTREELENLPLADLQKMLTNQNGSQNANVKVAPGKEVPFTVIFSGLPDDIELQEYAVEISGSLPVTKPKSK